MGFTLTLHKSCNKQVYPPQLAQAAHGMQVDLRHLWSQGASTQQHIPLQGHRQKRLQRFQGMRYILDGLEKRHVYTDARHLPGFFSREQDNDVQKKWGLQNATFLKERWLKFFMTSWQLSEPPNLAPPKSPVVDWVLGFNAHDNKNPKTNFCLNRRLTYFVNFGTIFEFLQEVFFQYFLSMPGLTGAKPSQGSSASHPHPPSFGNPGAVQVKPGHPGCNPVGSALDPFG